MPTVIDGTNGVTFPAGGVGNPAGTVVGTTDTQTLTNKTISVSQLSGTTSEANGGTGTTTGYYGFKNRIINGAMMIDQRNAGASVTGNDATFSVDRWVNVATQTSKFTVQQNAGSVTPPAGFTNYLGVTSSSAYAVTATDYFNIRQRIEGFNVADLGWGTANAQAVTVSFWVRSSLTGAFGGNIANSAANRSYPFSFTINSANTWEYKTVTIPGDTTGTWLTNNSAGLMVSFNLGAGSTYSGTVNTWAGTFYSAPTGATSVVGTNGATFYITGVQLEKGSTATSFDYRPYGTELMLCQRYYQQLDGYQGVGSSSTTLYAMLAFQVAMRANPSIGQTGVLQITDAVAADYTQSSTNISINSSRVSNYSVNLQAGNFSGMTSYRPYICKSGAGGYVTLSAEL